MRRVFESDEQLKSFIIENVITTMEAAEILNCSRQNIDRLVDNGKLVPVKRTQRDKLFWKADVLARVKPAVE